MKMKILTLLTLLALAGPPLEVAAYERNFPAGSIIIPMDAYYQAVADGGQLEAYGLVYYLLNLQDQQCLSDAGSEVEAAACEHTVGVSWVINDQKTKIDGIDLEIEDDTLPRTEDGVKTDAVVKLYDHDGGTKNINFNTVIGDSKKKITYRGGIWIIDVQELDDGVEDEVYAVINGSSWSAVDVHVAQVPFAAPVYRDLRGTPPKIALMNDSEDKTKGNASILESYLRLAGICSDSYEVVTPNEIAGYEAGDTDTKITPILQAKGYDFLWAPHWDAEKNYDGTGGCAHKDEVVQEIQNYLKSGKGLLAECASIETFEHNPYGHFLADKDFAHNHNNIKAEDPVFPVIYNEVTVPYTQIGDYTDGFEPEGGHLHNWRPFQAGDVIELDPPPDVSDGNSVYNATVKRFTYDSADWDFFVGGYAYGNTDYGYVVYLGGHKYAECGDAKTDDKAEDIELVVDPELNAHDMTFEFTKDVSGADFTLQVDYYFNYEEHAGELLQTDSISFASDDLTAKVGGWNPDTGGLPLQIDFTSATIDDKTKKFQNIIFRNTFPGVPLDIETITLSWTGGAADLKIKKLIDDKTDTKHYDDKAGSASVFTLNPTDFVIDGAPSDSGGGGGGTVASVGCTDNSGCSFINLAGVRYVLNTLFNIKYELKSYEYVRASPIVDHPWLYQGSFKYPSYYGHFRRYDVEEKSKARRPTGIRPTTASKMPRTAPPTAAKFTRPHMTIIWAGPGSTSMPPTSPRSSPGSTSNRTTGIRPTKSKSSNG